jgi:alpha-beta hydrolase superfamily lysophospholipase
MQVSANCTVRARSAAGMLVALLALAAGPLGAQQTAPATAPATGEASYVVFVNGRAIGREQANLARTPSGWTITSTGSMGAPLHLAIKRFEVTYATDWQPIELKIDATLADLRDPKAEPKVFGLATSFATTTAINEVTQNGVTASKTDQITARAVVMPGNFFAAYEALAVRLSSMTPGGELPIYVAPQGEIKAVVKAVAPATYETPGGTLKARRFSITFHHPDGALDVDVTVDERNRFAKADLPAAGVSIARQDLAGVETRQQTFRNPTDSEVIVPAAGFGLAGTLTTPAAQGRLRQPAIVLVAGAGPVDRDGTVGGIPMFAQLAGQLAERDFVVLRYDKRGVGKSGGRVERVTLEDYAEDAIAAVKWMAKRKDVDSERIFVAGHSEGAAVAMLAAAREKKVAGLVLLAGMGTTGRELILEQQQQLLAKTSLSETERAERVALQNKILDAVVAQQGWEGIPPEMRAAADTTAYRSVVTFDPARAMTKVKQPILILHGTLDRQVLPYHGDKLAELARARKKAASVEVKQLQNLNHLFVPAKTGDVSEYEGLEKKVVSSEVASAIGAWVAAVPR